jgi:hypothetical protein
LTTVSPVTNQRQTPSRPIWVPAAPAGASTAGCRSASGGRPGLLECPCIRGCAAPARRGRARRPPGGNPRPAREGPAALARAPPHRPRRRWAFVLTVRGLLRKAERREVMTVPGVAVNFGSVRRRCLPTAPRAQIRRRRAWRDG